MRFKFFSLRKIRNQRKFLDLFLILIITSFTFLIVYLFTNTDILRIKKLDCYLDNRRCSQEIWAGIYNLVSGRLSLALSGDWLGAKIQKIFPQYKNEKVEVKFPDRLVVNLSEGLPVAIAVFDFSGNLTFNREINLKQIETSFYQAKSISNVRWLVDERGVVYSEAEENNSLPRMLIKIKEPISLSSGSSLADLSFPPFWEIIQVLSDVNLPLKYGYIETQSGQMMVFSPDWRAIFSFNNTDFQVDSLQLILSRAKIEGKVPQLIDLRFEKPIVKYKD
ncbi:MAG TPA: hypothetical protein VMW41_04945 [Candidatus Bathyarchaeia archaeon]|nr:hypothetical protein [Candidatus Bathyarchaeia archaeon]